MASWHFTDLNSGELKIDFYRTLEEVKEIIKNNVTLESSIRDEKDLDMKVNVFDISAL